MIVTIGKAVNNDFIIDDVHISRYHAQLKITTQGDYLLEDLNSVNGTIVNGQQIVRKYLKDGDTILLGGIFKTSLSEILNKKNMYTFEFEALCPVYDQYQKKKVYIQSTNQFKTRLLQTLPFTVPGIVGICLSVGGLAGKTILYVSLFIAVVVPAFGIFLGARQAAKTPSQLQSLADQLKIDYICPKCKSFLGEIPWQSLKNKGNCTHSNCGAKW